MIWADTSKQTPVETSSPSESSLSLSTSYCSASQETDTLPGFAKLLIFMCRCKAKVLLSEGSGQHQVDFTCSNHEDLLLDFFFVACWSCPQRPSVLYRHLGYQLLSSSLRDGIFAKAGSHNTRSFGLRETSSDLSLPHWLMSWQRAIWFSKYLLL